MMPPKTNNYRLVILLILQLEARSSVLNSLIRLAAIPLEGDKVHISVGRSTFSVLVCKGVCLYCEIRGEADEF